MRRGEGITGAVHKGTLLVCWRLYCITGFSISPSIPFKFGRVGRTTSANLHFLLFFLICS